MCVMCAPVCVLNGMPLSYVGSRRCVLLSRMCVCSHVFAHVLVLTHTGALYNVHSQMCALMSLLLYVCSHTRAVLAHDSKCVLSYGWALIHVLSYVCFRVRELTCVFSCA